MAASYEDFKPFWEAWKRHSKEPTEADELPKWRGAHLLFSSLANGTGSPGPELEAAFNYLLQVGPEWQDALKHLPNWDMPSNILTLYRGIICEQAIHARCSIEQGRAIPEKIGTPVCYSIDVSVARGEAGRGPYYGLCYKLPVALDAILFFDHLRHTVPGGLCLEDDVIVWHRNPISIGPDQIIDRQVQFRKSFGDQKKAAEKIQKWVEIESVIRAQYT
jgi:hypothetical protein